MEIFFADTPPQLERCYRVLKELRPHLAFDDYLSIHAQARANDGYRIVAAEKGGEIIAVMGYRFLSDFIRGRHLYIDDLVSAANVRSQGVGAALLRFAERQAVDAGCSVLRLCTGVENERGVNFYERNGWTKRAYAFTKSVR